jgi:hypothetical protein
MRNKNFEVGFEWSMVDISQGQIFFFTKEGISSNLSLFKPEKEGGQSWLN